MPRALARWDEVAWQYAAYNHPTLEALTEGRLGEALTLFAGLHPPLYPLIHSLLTWLWPAPVLWLVLSIAASTGAVAFTLRGGRLAALLVACGAVQLTYAAEVNNSSLMALAVAGIWWARDRVAQGHPWWELAAMGILGGWTHGLAGWAAVIAALTLGPGQALRIGAVIAVGISPLAPGILALATEPGNFQQPPFKLGLIASDVWARFGAWWLLLLPLAAMGARQRPALALGLVATEGLVVTLQWVGLAAPHQFPYHLAAGIPLAWLVGAGVQNLHRHRTRALTLALAVAGLQALGSLALDLRSLAGIVGDSPRAIDLALAEAAPGDAIVLLAPSRLPDDDKRGSSPVLWRIPPWQALPPVTPYAFDPADHRHGQPRDASGVAIYVHDEPRDTLESLVAAHARTWVVVYEHREDPRYTRELDERLGPGVTMGSDRLHRLP